MRMGMIFRMSNHDLVRVIGQKRVSGAKWWQIAADLNSEGAWHVTQTTPWSGPMVSGWYFKVQAQARTRAQSNRMDQRVRDRAVELYQLYRDRPARVQRTLDVLHSEIGTTTPSGTQITRQWVSGLVAARGLRVRAEESSWRRAARRRPRTRSDCEDGPRPCPWASCRHHLARSVIASARRNHRNSGGYQISREIGIAVASGDFSGLEHTCVLDIIEDEGPAVDGAGIYCAIDDGSRIGRILGITRELVRLDIERGIAKATRRHPDVGRFLRQAYDASVPHRRRRRG